MRPRDKDDSEERLGNINDKRPAGAPPVPTGLLDKYSHQIEKVWWHAKGREEDPAIGVEILGVRKTYSGYTHNDWWYFKKLVHPASDEEEGARCYWYRKKKIQDPDNPDQYKIVEEYVGAKLYNPDTGYGLEIPQELRHNEDELCS
jgi:hypothetical protein